MKKKIVVAFALLFVIATTPGILAAQEAAQDEAWKFGIELYGWAAWIGGKSASGSDIDIDFDDIIDSLDMTFMSAFGARKGKWSVMTDVIYMDLKNDKDVAPGENASVELKAWVVTPAIGYNVLETEKASLHILGGARYLYLKAELGLTGFPDVSDCGSVWDGIIGLKGQVNLAEKWYIPFYGDIGTGDSDLTWQVMAGIAYKFKKFDVFLAYRYLDWDFDDNAVIDDMNINGPLVGIKFVF